MIKLASKKDCTGCMACVDCCPKNAIFSFENETGHLYPKINKTKCIECGKCIRICPQIKSLSIKSKKEIYSSVPFAAWSLDNDLRNNSASGGVFASLAKIIILMGGVVVGAKMDGFETTHVIIDDLSLLRDLQGSKYMQGNLCGIYKAIRDYLDKGRVVLFSGVPCQIVALKSYLQKEYDNLYTIDLICGGFPSSLPIKLFRKKYPHFVLIKSFRDKEKGWKSSNYSYSLKVQDVNGSVFDMGINNFPIVAFGASITHRMSCFNCKWATPERLSDITIGDYWGDKAYPEQHYDGLSLIVVHSLRGMHMLEKANIKYKETSWHSAIEKNMALVNGRKFTKFHFARIFMAKLYKSGSYDGILNMYKGHGICGLLYKLDNFVLNNLSKLNKRLIYKKIAKKYN